MDITFLLILLVAFSSPINGELLKFGNEYGLYGIHTVLKTKDGMLLFGGDHRILSYDPNDRLGKRPPSKVSIKSITRPSGSAKTVQENNYKFSFRKLLTFEFFIDDYSSPAENIYTYKLTGVDDQWVQPGHNHRVSYANLNPCDYTFMVKGAVASGTWSENVATIDFTVLPPWWLTIWAKIGYLLLAIALGYITYQVLAFRSKKRRELKELKYEKEQSELLTQYKLRFFTNISHELRAPLTVMIPSAEKISGDQPLDINELKKTRKHHQALCQRLVFTGGRTDAVQKYRRRFTEDHSSKNQYCHPLFQDIR